MYCGDLGQWRNMRVFFFLFFPIRRYSFLNPNDLHYSETVERPVPKADVRRRAHFTRVQSRITGSGASLSNCGSANDNLPARGRA
jgi:hypothetical protein